MDDTLLLYRRGIQCYNSSSQKALYSYDLPDFVINESRVLFDFHNGKSKVAKFLSMHASKRIAEKILSTAFEGDKYEGYLDWWGHTDGMSQAWRDAIDDKIIVHRDVSGFYIDMLVPGKFYSVSREMCRAIKQYFPDVPVYGIGENGDESSIFKPIEMTPKMEYLLKKSNDFFEEIKYSVDYPIEVVEFQRENRLTLTKSGKILLSNRLFDKGQKDIVMNIMDSNERLKLRKNEDAFEDMKAHYLRSWVTQIEEQHGVFL